MYLASMGIKDFNKTCESTRWNHRKELYFGPISRMNCSKLYNIYPFVFKKCENNMCEETLKIGENIIHKFVYKEKIE